MVANKEKARSFAKSWWTLDVAANSRARGYAVCDSWPTHRIPVGGGYLCNPSHAGDKTPDLVCEECFDEAHYAPWDGGYSS